MVFVQKWPFYYFLFLSNIGQENVFYDIVERRNAFLGYENKKFKKSKNCIFGFCPFFQPFFFTNIAQENVFYDILERKNALLG